MKLIVGLGNPGKEYVNTRHNIGFYFLDHYDPILQSNWKRKCNALYTEIMLNNEKIYFLKPETYMNNSGEAVAAFMKFYKIDINDLLVISDDMDLPLGTYRLRSHGSCGGHNGLRSIENHLHTNCYKRLRIGIGQHLEHEVVDYVLGQFSVVERKTLIEMIPTINRILTDFQQINFDNLMSKYNHRG